MFLQAAGIFKIRSRRIESELRKHREAGCSLCDTGLIHVEVAHGKNVAGNRGVRGKEHRRTFTLLIFLGGLTRMLLLNSAARFARQ